MNKKIESISNNINKQLSRHVNNPQIVNNEIYVHQTGGKNQCHPQDVGKFLDIVNNVPKQNVPCVTCTRREYTLYRYRSSIAKQAKISTKFSLLAIVIAKICAINTTKEMIVLRFLKLSCGLGCFTKGYQMQLIRFLFLNIN